MVCTVCVWLLNPDFFVNFFGHFEQAHVFSPEWIKWCFVRLPNWENFFSQIVQLNGFSPVCTLKWVLRWLTAENIFTQCGNFFPFSDPWFNTACCVKMSGLEKDAAHLKQKYGFSFVCDAMCLFKSFSLLKAFSQNTHANGLSFEWTVKWALTSAWVLNLNWQISHLNGLSPVCTRKWRSSSEGVKKAFSHTEQAYCFLRFCLVSMFASFDVSADWICNNYSRVFNFYSYGNYFVNSKAYQATFDTALDPAIDMGSFLLVRLCLTEYFLSKYY